MTKTNFMKSLFSLSEADIRLELVGQIEAELGAPDQGGHEIDDEVDMVWMEWEKENLDRSLEICLEPDGTTWYQMRHFNEKEDVACKEGIVIIYSDVWFELLNWIGCCAS